MNCVMCGTGIGMFVKFYDMWHCAVCIANNGLIIPPGMDWEMGGMDCVIPLRTGILFSHIGEWDEDRLIRFRFS